MKRSTIALSLIALFISVGCSDKKNAAPETAPATVAAPAAPTAPAAPKAALSKEMPAEIKDLPSKEAGLCAIDLVNSAPVDQNIEAITINRADGLNVDGWALDDKSAAVSPVVILQLSKGEERYYAPLARHGGRDDLPKGFGKPEYANAGYSASVDIASLPAGEYELRIHQKADGNNFVCSTKHKLNLKS